MGGLVFGARRAWVRFRAEEAGSMTIFALFIFVAILMIGGIAVDVVRYEHRRVHLQNTADRAALAAGSLRQPNDPEQVVREYFAREGLEDHLVSVTVDEGLNFRTVHVETSAVVPTIFMKLFGIEQLVTTPASTAEERYSKVEVSLVLDLSNSMNSFSRIDNLRVAGQDFIDTLFENAEPGQISVSVVPYTGQVNVGPLLLDYFTNVTHRISQSHCVELGSSSFATMALDPSATMVGAGHFDPWHSSASPVMFFCPTHTGRRAEIVPFSGDRTFLRNHLSQLMADGNTSIELGVKWGAFLLDPSSRPIITDLIDRGLVPEDFRGRPLDYNDPDVLKVIVIMTDGENFEQWIMADAVKTGPSNMYLNPADNRVSLFHSSRTPPNQYYVPHNNTWQNRPWGAPSSTNFGSVVRMDWVDVWTRFTVRYVAWNLTAVPLGSTSSQRSTIYNDRLNAWLSRIPASTKNVYLDQMCSTAKSHNIPIFTVAFEAPPGGVQAMRNCATSPSHFFDVEGTDIRKAFKAIAGTINRLRLTQ